MERDRNEKLVGLHGGAWTLPFPLPPSYAEQRESTWPFPEGYKEAARPPGNNRCRCIQADSVLDKHSVSTV